MAIYDHIGTTYSATRRPDHRIAAHVHEALGDARSVVNVGAGTGSYEPPWTRLAVEPSAVMIRQRPVGAAPVVRARAEALPVADDAVDAAMALLTVHHWENLERGIAELRRIARRVVVFTWDQRVTREFWLLSEYLPEATAFEDRRAVPIDRLAALLGNPRITVVPLPHDCVDGVGAAYWRRPDAYLDPTIRAGMSMLAQHDAETLRPGLDRLAADLASGRWHDRHRDLLDLDQLDVGYRLLVAER
ncbi:methyltransferase domain-containing protein [Asanoa sp. NPDC050611]|uniref:methyltransferase domain-containing protein n=1 Tax=Asanoa sp. NPDC050611 TaxID=3157098 RepID=UPI0033CCEE24